MKYIAIKSLGFEPCPLQYLHEKEPVWKKEQDCHKTAGLEFGFPPQEKQQGLPTLIQTDCY